MIGRALSCTVRGIAGVPVTVEAFCANGLPQFAIVGLTDRAIQEARDRIRVALPQARFEFPQQRVTVNLAPAEVPKEGTGFDLAIAVALIASRRDAANPLDTAGRAFVGELGMDGSVRGVTGVLPMARCLHAAGVRELVVAAENSPEAALVEGLRVIGVPSLRHCIAHLDGTEPLEAARGEPPVRPPEAADLASVRGQATARRALEVAAAGGHNLLMIGPPGSGKTMLARAFCSLLPDLDNSDTLEVAALFSLRGVLRERPPTSLRPPLRAPHHSVSRAGLIGGGSGLAQPGEVSLAHRGVLFLDELCEFPRAHLEALRQPLEDRAVSVGRSRGTVVFPADFILIAAANPCPCGRLGEPQGCRCAPSAVAAYSGRLSGPLRDRIDLVIHVPRQRYDDLFVAAPTEDSVTVRARVEAARALQAERRADPAGRPFRNASLEGAELRRAAAAGADAMRLLAVAGERLQLSARAYFRVLRVARTIADLRGGAAVGEADVAEALAFRGEQAG
ncbi:MAG: YifB family Mg chelatase-like AAA ATPase [Candidatus Dormibacteria bacterium]